ncbi:MAG TPA: hypothetical protein VK797_17450 [Tepidisphaeraceae bacterium]|nr:hypothetical protein [Tepidisphaeraceae bacterium]
MFQLKPISADAIPSALVKAERYRLLNEPVEAESICRDVLDIDHDNQPALTTLLLALTDQFGQNKGTARVEAEQLLPRLQGEYEHAYYAGIICERWAKTQLDSGTPGHVVHDWLHVAMEWYEKAEPLAPPGNDDAILRWNACVRLIAGNEQIKPFDAQFSLADDFGNDMMY